MKAVYAPLGFALGASAALIPRDQCCFSLTASGGESGVLGQLGDGQNRVGQSGGLATQQATYCLNNGGLTDQSGRGCILTPPTTQFQCDAGASPTTGFAVNSNGDLTYNGNTQFYACATGDNGGYNVYTSTTSAQSGCVKIMLNTGGKCAGNGGSSASASQPASSAPASSGPASSAPASSAPASSAPASSAPASSAPASSAPASSAPASSAPPASQPASSAPANSATGSQPAGPQTSTVYTTHYQTITSCSAEVASCPAQSTVTVSTPAAVTTAPASPQESSTYACNPAHSYPGGVSCISTNGGLSLVYPSTSAPGTASSAPGTASSAPGNGASATAAQPADSSAATQSVDSSPAASQPASSAPAASGTSNGNGGASACQTSLTGAYQTPHAIIPINKDQPSKSYGTQYNAYMSSSNSTIFNFDIPQSYSGKQCSVVFLFPKKEDLETSDFTQSGSGGLKFDQLTSAAPMDVTYSSCPAVKSNLNTIGSVMPGNSYVVSTGPCQAGTTVSYDVSSTGDMSVEFFEDWNPSPIGLFVTSC